MYSELNTFSLMGMSNISDNMFLSEKDLGTMEFNFLVKPTLEFPYGSQFSSSDSEDGELHDQKQQAQEKEEEITKEEKCNIAVSCLQLKMPSPGEFKVEDEDEDGIRTPTSLNQRIPLILPCPPAPRKPKSLPSTKRKSARRQILLDLSNEVESLFPPALLADLGGKIKKVRKGNCTDL